MLLWVSLETELAWPIFLLLPDALFVDAVRPAESICDDNRPWVGGAVSFFCKLLIEAEFELEVR